MSIRKRLTPAEVESIYSGANAAVWHSHHFAAQNARSAAREEDYVAALVTDGVPVLAHRWISLLSKKGIALKIAGVFCHGHPQVAFGTPQSKIELADLLVVHQHQTKVRTTSRAMLIQAKMSADATHRLSPSDPQLALFSTWPDFEFVTGGLAPGFRNLKEVGKGSRYALVLDARAYPEDITWADQCPWAACAANQNLSAERSFAKMLGDMLLEKDGRTVQIRRPKDAWSQTIVELLKVTGKRTYRRTNIGRGDTPRLSISASASSGMMFFTQSSSFLGNTSTRTRRSVSELFFGAVPSITGDRGDGVPPESVGQHSQDGGMSTLIIESWEVQ